MRNYSLPDMTLDLSPAHNISYFPTDFDLFEKVSSNQNYLKVLQN